MKLSAKEKAKGISVATYTVKDVITKRIPTRFILNERLSYRRATKKLGVEFAKDLEDDRNTGLKKFTIVFTKKIGVVNE